MKPWLSDPDVDIHVGDALEVLRGLPDGSVDCCVTSPPYWGLRDYGTGSWTGGNADCDHDQRRRENDEDSLSAKQIGPSRDSLAGRDSCRKCGAHRVDRQLGLEATPDLYVAGMVAVFAEVRRVLADHGTLWLNIGDSYAANGATGHGGWDGNNKNPDGTARQNRQAGDKWSPTPTAVGGLKPKDLCGIPWRLAFALQADGWWLRSDIIWAKPNPMPESVTDRPTKAHEYVFLLSKRPSYWFDQEAVREPHTPDGRLKTIHAHAVNGSHENYANMGTDQERWPNGGRNVRSVWSIATQPYPDAHFATFPEELPRRAILAGCPEWVCATCGKARERLVERSGGTWEKRKEAGHPIRYGADQPPKGLPSWPEGTFGDVAAQTVGWSDCGHAAYRPGTVLDPFLGSGTTAHVARKHGRRCVGIELNETYAELAARRLQQLSLLAEGGYA